MKTVSQLDMLISLSQTSVEDIDSLRSFRNSVSGCLVNSLTFLQFMPNAEEEHDSKQYS